MKIVCVIPARLSSKRLPNKILMQIDGITMLEHVYRKVIQSQVDDVFIACDDEVTLRMIHSFGGKGIMTSKSHTSGTARIHSTLDEIEADYILNVQADEPLINPNSIDLLLKSIDNSFEVYTLCTSFSKTENIDDPNLVKTFINNDSSALVFTRETKHFDSRVYKHLGVYLYSKDILKTFYSLPMSINEKNENLEQLRFLDNGIPIKLVYTNDNAYGVNTIEEFEHVKNLIKSNKLTK